MPDKIEDPMDAYRRTLVEAAYKSQEDFDKTVLALSGGALGVSFTFLKDVVGTAPISGPWFLIGAWVAWALASSCVLASYQLSHQALRRAIRQVDEGTIRQQRPGGVFARITAWLNVFGALAFVLGVLSITTFAAINFTKVSPAGIQSKPIVNAPPQDAVPLGTNPSRH